jgi:hypothetical protein
VATPTEIRQRLDAEIEQIRGYVDLTEEAKERRIAEAREKANAEYQEAVEAEERAVQERAEKAEKALFQSSYPYGASEVEMAQLRPSVAVPMTPYTTGPHLASSPETLMACAMPVRNSRGS